MSDVLIRGMKMPTSEEKCKFFQPAPFRAPFCVINGVCNGIDACPLIEVPPHGRLIDADAMNEKYGDWYTEEGTEEGFIGALKYLIAEQQTIIEKEE